MSLRTILAEEGLIKIAAKKSIVVDKVKLDKKGLSELRSEFARFVDEDNVTKLNISLKGNVLTFEMEGTKEGLASMPSAISERLPSSWKMRR